MSSTYTTNIKVDLPTAGDTGWDNNLTRNWNLIDLLHTVSKSKNRVISGGLVSDSGGLVWASTAGSALIGGTLFNFAIDGTTLTGASPTAEFLTYYIYVDNAGVVTSSSSLPTGDFVLLAAIDVSDIDILRVADLRSFIHDSEFTIENDLINGTFEHWQRATTQTSSGYGSDDHSPNFNTGSTKIHSRQAFTPGQTSVPGNPTYYSRTVVTSVVGVANFALKAFRVKDVTKYSGKTVAFKFHGKVGSAKNVSIEGSQIFGSGGSASVYSLGVQKIGLTTSWVKNVLFIDFPSVSGKTIGTNNYTQISIWFDAGSDYDARTSSLGQQSGTFDISEVEIYVAERELPVRRRTREEELDKCFVFCWRQTSFIGLIGSAAGADHHLGTQICFPVRMNATPTLTVNGSFTYTSNSKSGAADNGRTDGFRFRCLSTVANGYVAMDMLGDTSNYIIAEAELS